MTIERRTLKEIKDEIKSLEFALAAERLRHKSDMSDMKIRKKACERVVKSRTQKPKNDA